AVLARLWDVLLELDIHPSGWVPEGDDPSSVVEPEAVAEIPVTEVEAVADEELPVEERIPAIADAVLTEYGQFDGEVVQGSAASRREMIDGLVRLVEAEGPVLGNRLHTAYVRASGSVRVTKLVAGELNKAISQAVREGRLAEDNPLGESGIKPRTY